MRVRSYMDSDKKQVIDLILNIQNCEAKINLTLDEQPDLSEIESYYMGRGGNFWIAEENGEVIGTIGLMVLENKVGVLKKFFVRSDYRGKRIGLMLFDALMEYCRSKGLDLLILDTPSVAHKSHLFYEKAGFVRTTKESLPVAYEYPDRDSLLYMLNM